MRLKYLPALTMLTAGAIISIIDIIHKVQLYVALKRLLFVLVLFYIIGLIAKTIIGYALLERPKPIADEDNEEETNKDEQDTEEMGKPSDTIEDKNKENNLKKKSS